MKYSEYHSYYKITSELYLPVLRVLFTDQRPATVSFTSVHPALRLAGTHHLRDDGLAGVGVEPDTGLLLDQGDLG